MSDHVYKKIEVVGSSTESIEKAAQRAVKKASESVHNLRWMEVTDIRGHLVDGEIDHWQVGVKIGFTMESESAPETLEEK
ncbi:MAG: dodecin family protein [Kiritimatiellae bacterium]|jgi:flavin-binding protein dodecin|nr:dodecin family protein [Kiritimatiellia bacterium]